MKKIVLLILIILLTNSAFSQFSGNYNIGAGETYTTLKAACDALNAGTITGNCTFYITSNLTEAVNVGLGVNTNGYSITFKPSADADRTITFQQTTDNTGPSGGFVIGASDVNAWASLVTTDNVIIDGYATGGETRRLIWTNTITTHYLCGPITIAEIQQHYR